MPASAALGAALAALALATPAAAQAPPPDERAAARAFADAALRLDAALQQRGDELARAIGARTRGCRALLRRMPERRKPGVGVLLGRQETRLVAALVRPDLAAFRAALADAQTRDPALLSGRAAWRQAGRFLDAVPEPGDACAEVRAWRDAGFPRRTIRRARSELEAYFELPGREFDRKVAAASRRLQALGVPPSEAAVFAAPGEGGGEVT